MKQKPNDRHCAEGRLPAMAPLANAYVPFQHENPPVYDARKGFIRGTIFPGLDLPFQGMVNTKEKPLTHLNQLQTMAFVIQELTLYLDTHCHDEEALALYHTYQKMYADALEEYTRKHGPMNSRMFREGKYCWLNDPWPWEYCANKEA